MGTRLLHTGMIQSDSVGASVAAAIPPKRSLDGAPAYQTALGSKLRTEN
jgi:hypothetical protein